MTSELRRFLDDADINIRLAIDMPVEPIGLLKEVDEVFESLTRTLASPKHILFPSFASHSHFAFRAAVRVLLGGQVVETYPLLRLALENAMYAFHTSDEAIALAWAKRGLSPEDTRRVRQEFQIRKIREALKKEHLGLAESVDHLYELAIDHGAHPNVDGHVASSQFADDGVAIDCLAPDTMPWKICVQRLVRAGVVCLLILRAVPESRFSPEALDRLEKIDSVTASWKEFRRRGAQVSTCDSRS